MVKNNSLTVAGKVFPPLLNKNQGSLTDNDFSCIAVLIISASSPDLYLLLSINYKISRKKPVAG